MPPKTLHLVRHAEGYHQITPDGDNIRDPDLTPYGIDVQCAHLREIFPSHAAVSLLCSSPMRRAIRTALTAFAPEVTRGMRIRALPDAQEARNVASDTGVGAAELRKTFADDVVDYALVTGDWYHKSGPYATDMASLQARARRLRRYLRDDCEGEEVVLVTHGLFAHYLTGNIDESGRQTGQSI